MPRQSSIDQLPEEVQEAVHHAIRNGATVDGLVEVIEAHGASVSRSAAGRYKQRVESQMERYRQAQEMASVWVGKLEEDPDSDVGRLLSEMLRTVAFQTISTMGEEEGQEAKPGDIMFLAKAIKELAGADKLSTERELQIRKEVAKQAAAEAESSARKAGLSQGDAKAIKEKVLGVVS